MMSFLKKALFAALMLGAFSTAAFAAEAEIPDEHIKNVNEAKDEQISILCVGNSILNHGPNQDIGWSGSWGMAASSKDKDYFHLLQKKVEDAGYSNVSWSAVGVATLERAIDKRTDYDYKSEIASYLAPSVDKAKPDVVIFQIGENVNQGPTRESYKIAMTKLAEYCVSVNPDVQVIFCMPFWGGESKCMGVKDAAEAMGFTYADLSQFNTTENMAIGLFEHGGVAAHPGDAGMANIAKEIFEQLSVVLHKKYVDPEQVAVKLNGKYLYFDVLPQITDSRTMIPVRAVAEAFGAEVGWDGDTETVTIVRPGTKITMKLGENFFMKNDTKMELDVPAFETGGRTLIPARAVAEALDCKVEWDEANWTAIITAPEKVVAKIGAIDNDPCDTLAVSGFYPGSSKLNIKDDDDAHGKAIYVETTAIGKVWTYVWAKMDLEPGKTYTIEADLKALPKDGAGNDVDTVGIGFCMHHDSKDHAVKVTTVKVADGWVRATAEYTIPADGVKNDDDRFGIYANPVNDIAASFAIDNITVKVKE